MLFLQTTIFIIICWHYYNEKENKINYEMITRITIKAPASSSFLNAIRSFEEMVQMAL